MPLTLVLPSVTHVALALCAYMLSIRATASARDALRIPRGSVSVRAFATIHNLALAAFSLAVAYHAVPLALARLASGGLVRAACTPLSAAEEWWTMLFYFSKFYEFVDTWLVVLAHRRPSFLQTFHHVGIVVTMHASLAVRGPGMLTLTAFNATIHTLMYAYYALASIGRKPPGAQILTSLQLAQFVVGVLATCGAYASRTGACADPRVVYATVLTHAYVAVLVVLFARFYRARYLRA
jgi:hypothetical protein